MTATEAGKSVSRQAPGAGLPDEPLDATTAKRNGQATRQRILDAAFAEFAAAGLAGARVDRIAANAGCNKSLIFVYFQSKAALFETVVGSELERINGEVGTVTDGALQFAARLFDFAMSHPSSMRLLAWYELETESDSRPKRRVADPSRCLGLRPASPDEQISAPFPAGFLPTAIIALSTAWSDGNLIGRVLGSSQNGDPDHVRDALLGAVRKLAEWWSAEKSGRETDNGGF